MANANNNTQPDALTGLIDATQLHDILSVYAAAIKANKTSLGNKVNSSTFTSHTGDKNNPHGVTCEQIGALGLDALHLCTFVSDTEYPDLF